MTCGFDMLEIRESLAGLGLYVSADRRHLARGSPTGKNNEKEKKFVMLCHSIVMIPCCMRYWSDPMSSLSDMPPSA